MRQHAADTHQHGGDALLLGLLASVVAAILIGLLAYQRLVALPVLPPREKNGPWALVQQVSSHDRAWRGSSYFRTEGGLATMDLAAVVVSENGIGGKGRLVYYGLPVHLFWRGDSTLVAREDASGQVHRLNVVSGRYDMRFNGRWNTAVTVATILVPAGATALAGIVVTLLVRRRRARR